MRLQRSAVQNPGMEERACPPSVRWRLLACALAAGLAAMSGRAVAADCTGALTKLSACTSVDGDVTIGSEMYFAVSRYNPNGTLDTSFGSNGTATVSSAVRVGMR